MTAAVVSNVGGDIYTLRFTKDGLFVTADPAGSYPTIHRLKWKRVLSLKDAYRAPPQLGSLRSTNNGKT